MNHHNVFSTISPTAYAEVSVLARLVGENMLSRLELVTLQPRVIVDLGCGTGQDATLLKQRYPHAQVTALDITETMLRHMRQLQGGNAVCADAVRLPFRDHSVDLIFANMLLPWCEDWEIAAREWQRVLRPEGLLVFSCLGLDTLRELNVVTLQLKDMHEIGDLLVQSRFSDPVMDVEYFTLTYREREKLFYELQMNGVIPVGIEPQLDKNAQGVFPLTYEIIYGHTWGPEIATEYSADESGEVRIPISHLRGRRGIIA